MKTETRGAFSLVELLAVVAVVAMLAGISIVAIGSGLRALAIDDAGGVMASHLNHARQVALSRNLAVEVRIYKLPGYDEDPQSAPQAFRAMQSFVYEGATAVPLAPPQYFRAPVIFSPDPAESSMLGLMTEKSPLPVERIPNYGVNYTYRSFYFKPDGAAAISAPYAFLSVVLGNGKPVSEGGNFATVQLETASGRAQVFRP